MKKTVGIIGGDLRIIRLAEILTKEDYLVYTYALDKYTFADKNIIKCNRIQEACNNCNNIVSGVPFSKDSVFVDTPFSNVKIKIEDLLKEIKSKTLIAGGINKNAKDNAQIYSIKVMDLLEIEELTILNVIPTVEGAIKVAIEETEFTINGSKCLILGFGRIGKLLAKSLKSLNAKVYCLARKEKDLAWIKAFGYNGIDLKDLDQKLNKKYDIIFNTVPNVILDRTRLEIIKNNNPLIIELASKPWGVDFEAAEELGIKAIKAPGLPGKVAPLTSAINIKNIIEKLEFI